MSRLGRSTPLDPAHGDTFTMLDGSRWSVVDVQPAEVRIEELGTKIANTVLVPLRDLLVAVNGWERACRLRD